MKIFQVVKMKKKKTKLKRLKLKIYQRKKKSWKWLILKILLNFIKGFWEKNEHTKIIEEKYSKEFNSLKEFKELNINERVAISILVVLFIYSEQKELIDELYLIIKKAKIFIRKETNDTYENILNKLGIN